MHHFTSLLLTLVFASSLSLAEELASVPWPMDNQNLIENNDAGEMIFENDTLSGPESPYQPRHHKYFHYKLSFEEVSKVITPDIEDAFDLFIFANVSYQAYGSPNDIIPSQRMRIYRKPNSRTRIFNRDMRGQIQAYNPVSSSAYGTSDHKPAIAGLPGEIPISSGAGHKGRSYVDTFSGVFRLNHKKSRSHRHQDGMIHSLYVDIKYPWGKTSGIAVHGTPKSNYKFLGQQASHGCIRVKQSVSLPLYEYAMGRELYTPNLVDFSRSQRLPLGPLKNPRPGQRVLMIYFYGYHGNRGLDL